MKDKVKNLITNKYFKRTMTVLAGFILIRLLVAGLDYLYVTADDMWYRILFHGYYQHDDIDNVYIGSSHVYMGVDPSIIDDLSGEVNFNMSAHGQGWERNYYLLKEVAKDNDIKRACFECFYRTVIEMKVWDIYEKEYRYVDYTEDPYIYAGIWATTYEMKPSLNKFALLKCSMADDHFIEACFPFVRYRDIMFDFDGIASNVKTKRSEGYKNYVHDERYTDENGVLRGNVFYPNGFMYIDKELTDELKLSKREQDLTISRPIGEKTEEYMRKSIQFCLDNGIEPILFCTPVDDVELVSTGNYQGYIDAVQSLADEYGIQFYDFNLLKDEYIDIRHGEYFMGIDHLNGKGAEVFSPVLWDVISSSPEENASKFYDTYEEHLNETEPQIYGIYMDGIDPTGGYDDEGLPQYQNRIVSVASNRQNMEYKIAITITDEENSTHGQEIVLQDFDTNNKVILPYYQNGMMHITGRCEGKTCEMFVRY